MLTVCWRYFCVDGVLTVCWRYLVGPLERKLYTLCKLGPNSFKYTIIKIMWNWKSKITYSNLYRYTQFCVCLKLVAYFLKRLIDVHARLGKFRHDRWCMMIDACMCVTCTVHVWRKRAVHVKSSVYCQKESKVQCANLICVRKFVACKLSARKLQDCTRKLEVCTGIHFALNKTTNTSLWLVSSRCGNRKNMNTNNLHYSDSKNKIMNWDTCTMQLQIYIIFEKLWHKMSFE